MNKSRKTSNLYNIITYDDNGNVVLPASLSLGSAPASDDNSLKVGTTSWIRTYISSLSLATSSSVTTAIANLIDSAPSTLDTLNELAAALGDDANFAATITASIGTKESAITAGTTSQYWRGDKTWQTLPVYTLSGLGGVPITRTITINGTAYDLSANRSWSIAAGLSSFNTRTGDITLTSGDVTTALGYTPMPTITFNSPLVIASGGEVSIGQAGASANGYLSSTDWTTFNNKLSSSTAALTYLALAGGTLTGDLTLSSTNPRLYFTDSDNNPDYFISNTDGTFTVYDVTNSVGRFKIYSTGNAEFNNNLTTAGNHIVNGTLSFAAAGNVSFTSNDALSYPRLTGNYASAQLGLFRAGSAVGGMYIGGTGTGFYVFDSSFNIRLLIAQNGDAAFNSSTVTVGGNQVWHAGNLTNLNQLTNGPGYITSYSETDTLATVTARGASTNAGITVNGRLTTTAGGTYAVTASSSQRYIYQALNTSNSVNAGYGWWWFHSTNGDMGFHADGIGDLFTISRGGTITAGSSTGPVIINASTIGSYSPTLTGSGASGTWGISITGSAATLDGYSRNQTGGANTIVQRDSNGYIQNSYFYSSGGGAERNGSGLGYIAGFNSSDYYIRSYNSTAVASFLGLGSLAYSSATIPTNNNQLTNGAGYITGITSSNVTTALGYTPYNNTNPSGYITSADTVKGLNAQFLGTGSINVSYGYSTVLRNENGSGANTSYSPTLHMAASDTMWQIQGTYGTSGNGTMYFRQGYSGSWGNWLTMISSANIGSQSVSSATSASYLTGGDSAAYMLLYNVLSGDLNTYNSPGLYSAEYTGSSNRPIAQNGSFIQISDAGGTDVKTQWYYSSDGANIYMRLMWGNGSWRSWRNLIHDGNISSQTVSNSSSLGGYGSSTYIGKFGNGNGYYQADNWIQMNTNAGMFWPSYNGAHIYPNTATSYGSLRIDGTRNTWRGLNFGGSVTLMMNDNETGHYKDGYGWQWRWYQGSMFVSRGTYGGSTEYTVIDSGTIGSQSVSNATTIAGVGVSTIRGGISSNSTSFYVNGDANTYYPVVLSLGGQFGMNRYSISRGYSDPAPWDPIGTGSHKGGLTLTFDCSSDIAWGGNDKSWRIIQFSESYTNMVAGMALPVTDGIIVWLRGGGAYYNFQGPSGVNHSATVYYSGYSAANGAVYYTRTNLNSVDSEIRAKWPIRGHGDGAMYVANNEVLHLGNYISYMDKLYYQGSQRLWTGSDGTRNSGWAYHQDNNTGIHWPNNGWHFYPKDASDMYVRSGDTGAVSLVMNAGGTNRGYVYANSSNEIGFLNNSRNWIFRMTNSGDAIMDYNYGNSIVGVYSSYRYQGVFAMGNAYKLAIDGTSPGNLYGLSWSHPNAGGQAGYLDSHGLLVMVNGITYSAISNSIWARGDVTAYSDSRVKTNVTVIENALEKVQAIRGVTFNRTDLEHDTSRHAGVIAQEVLKVLPEVVTTTKDGMHSVAYGNLNALLIEAIKEQQTQIESQQSEIAELKDLVKQLLGK